MDRERRALSCLDFKELHEHFRILSSFERRSDGEGEAAARRYIRQTLDEAKIPCAESASKGILSFGGSGWVEIVDGETFRAKAWNFSPPVPRGGAVGKAVVLGRGDFPSGVLDYLAEGARTRDLEGRVVLSNFVSPQAILAVQDRGAAGFVICWPAGDEGEIHQSGTALWWGTPMPEESRWSPRIPVLAVNRRDGAALIDAARHGEAVLSLTCESAEVVADVPLLEAALPSAGGERHFILVGAHLDSKHKGATDNATGAALALSLVRALAKIPDRPWGVRICWWSGHEFGKYAGSSAYARARFDELDRFCVAYSNIDMPGLRGADDFKATSGPELQALTVRTLRDVTGRADEFSSRVRAWDQSFQNIGVSSFFVWSSTLRPENPDCTGGGTMPWWWHTESDTAEFCDPRVLETDARIYMAGLVRLLSLGKEAFDVPSLWNSVASRLMELAPQLPAALDLKGLASSLGEGLSRWRGSPQAIARTLRAVRLLNRIRCAARGAHLQDWGDVGEFVPGLSEAARVLRTCKENPRKEVIVLHYAFAQRNRLGLLARELAELTEGP